MKIFNVSFHLSVLPSIFPLRRMDTSSAVSSALISMLLYDLSCIYILTIVWNMIKWLVKEIEGHGAITYLNFIIWYAILRRAMHLIR